MIERTIISHKDVVNVNLIHRIQAVLNYRVEADWQELFIDNEQFKKLDYKSAEKVYLLNIFIDKVIGARYWS